MTQRQEHLRHLPHWGEAHHHVLSWPVPAETLASFQECLTGHTVLPVGVVGPLSMNLGQYRLDDAGEMREEGRDDDQVFVPLAHTEGGLSASVQRGVSAVALAGGVRTYVLADRMTRDSCFVLHCKPQPKRYAWRSGSKPTARRWPSGSETLPIRYGRRERGRGLLRD
jgi:hydroxymethylglutaryl-CoA reductase (NADPH)